jgi:hypothetical protein
VHGNNQRKEGDGSTKMLIDDLQPILAKKPLTAISKEDGQYFLSETLLGYLYYKRVVESSEQLLPQEHDRLLGGGCGCG